MKIALTTEEMLVHALYKYMHEDPQGRKPKRFELHPVVLAGLLHDMKEIYMVEYKKSGRYFHGVELIADYKATRPKMITADNQVEYL